MNKPNQKLMNDDNIKSLRSLSSKVLPSAQKIVLPELLSSAATNSQQGGATGAAKVPGNSDVSAVISDPSPLYQVKAQLQVRVGEATVTVGELLSAKEHQVLKLDRSLEQFVDLVLHGQVVARGQLVAVDGYFGVRITELPIPLQLGGRP